ncbi:MAG: hypothetical protein H6747_09565 [Deltaproteobacteria bacterium]|nr:hypothetical protein [Deltaproteobacteria bacterium]
MGEMIPASRPDWHALDLTSPVTSDPTPPAALELLAYVEWFSRAVCTAPYANSAKFFDGVTAGLGTRRLSAVIPVAVNKARFRSTRYGVGSTSQSATRASTATGGLGVYSDISSPVSGTSYYLTAEQQGGDLAVVESGNDTSTTSGAESYLTLPEALAPSVIELEVQNSAGWSLHVPKEGQTLDLETL